MTASVHSLGYLVVETTDLERWRELAVDVLGMAVGPGPTRPRSTCASTTAPPGSSCTPARRTGSSPSAGRSATGRPSARSSAGSRTPALRSSTAPHEQAEERRVQEVVLTEDPAGTAVEVFHGASLVHDKLLTTHGATFVTGGQGLGHVVLPTRNAEASYDFYTQVLGFRSRGAFKLPPGMPGSEPGVPTYLRFLSCNERHHALALAPWPQDNGIIHFMVEVTTLDDVGMALDRLHKRKFPLSSTLGRHTNDKMVSFYVATPERVRHRARLRRAAGPRGGLHRRGHHRRLDLGSPVGWGEVTRVSDHVVAPEEMRRVLGHFASGVTIVTGDDGGTPVGFACQSFTSVSLDPPLVLFCPAHTSTSWPRIQAAGAFSVNVLADDQLSAVPAVRHQRRREVRRAGLGPEPVGPDPARRAGDRALHHRAGARGRRPRRGPRSGAAARHPPRGRAAAVLQGPVRAGRLRWPSPRRTVPPPPRRCASPSRRRGAIAPLAQTWPDIDVVDAYEIALLNIRRRVASGATVYGHKVGLSSKAMQEMMGVDEPDYGHLLSDMVYTEDAPIPDRPVPAAAGRGRGRLRARRRPARPGLHGRRTSCAARSSSPRRSNSSTAGSRTGRSDWWTPSPTTPRPAASFSARSASSPTSST